MKITVTGDVEGQMMETTHSLMSNNDKNVEGSGNIKGLSGVTGCQHGCRDFVTCPCRIKRSSKKCYKVDPYACTEGSNKCSSGVTGFQGD